MRVLFVAQEISYEPQGIMSMSAVLKKAGHEVALTVASLEDPTAYARAYDPDILGYSVMTGSQRGYLELNLRIREVLNPLRAYAQKPPVLSVFGGPHPTFFPDMIDESGVDGVCLGEGEEALLDLVNELARVYTDGAASWQFRLNIPNWWFKVNGEVTKNAVRALIHNLSELPQSDRALIYDKVPSLASSGIKHFMSSRGCPYNCTYCFNHAYYQLYQHERRGYQRTVDDVIDEVKLVRSRWPLEQVIFVDDLFILRNEWLEELAVKWPAQVGLPFFCNVRANMLVKDPHKVELLKRAGCCTVSLGIETASDRIRVDLLKRHMSCEEIVQAGKLVRGAGMQLTATNILGLPTSTIEDELDTMRLNAQAQVSYAYTFLFQPYPGTELAQYAQDHDLMVGSFDDISEVAWDHSILVFESDEAKSQVEHLQRLFAIGVEWPWLEPAIRRMIKLPHYRIIDVLFWWVHKLHKGFAIYTRVHPVKPSPRELLKTARHFMRIKS